MATNVSGPVLNLPIIGPLQFPSSGMGYGGQGGSASQSFLDRMKRSSGDMYGTIPQRSLMNKEMMTLEKEFMDSVRDAGGVYSFTQSPEYDQWYNRFVDLSSRNIWLKKSEEDIERAEMEASRKDVLGGYVLNEQLQPVIVDNKPITFRENFSRMRETAGVSDKGEFESVEIPYIYNPDRFYEELGLMLSGAGNVSKILEQKIYYKGQEIDPMKLPRGVQDMVTIVSEQREDNTQALIELMDYVTGIGSENITTDEKGRLKLASDQIDPTTSRFSRDALMGLKNKFLQKQMLSGKDADGNYKLKDEEFGEFLFGEVKERLDPTVAGGRAKTFDFQRIDTREETGTGKKGDTEPKPPTGVGSEADLFNEKWINSQQESDRFIPLASSLAYTGGKAIGTPAVNDMNLGYVPDVPSYVQENILSKVAIGSGDYSTALASNIGPTAWHPDTGATFDLRGKNFLVTGVLGFGRGYVPEMQAGGKLTGEISLSGEGTPYYTTGVYVEIALDPNRLDTTIPTQRKPSRNEMVAGSRWIDEYKTLIGSKGGIQDNEELRRRLGFDERYLSDLKERDPEAYKMVLANKKLATQYGVDPKDPMSWFNSRSIVSSDIDEVKYTPSGWGSGQFSYQEGGNIYDVTQEGWRYSPDQVSLSGKSKKELTDLGFQEFKEDTKAQAQYLTGRSGDKTTYKTTVFIPTSAMSMIQNSPTGTYWNRANYDYQRAAFEEGREEAKSKY